MAKRKHNEPPTTDVPVRFVAVFLVIAMVIAGAKMGTRMNRVFAGNPSQVRLA